MFLLAFFFSKQRVVGRIAINTEKRDPRERIKHTVAREDMTVAEEPKKKRKTQKINTSPLAFFFGPFSTKKATRQKGVEVGTNMKGKTK